ncbi:MAG: hypothetical protein U9O82_14120 [Thermodesulfobacteriota bacterium]|nr:hypothetical protein [Thermodesulfobacteriota bacterium]
MEKTILTFPVLIVAVCVLAEAPVAMGGNKEMVEKSVREMDLLNRDVVYRIPGIPANGRIHVKAKITYPGGGKQITILEKEITPIQAGSEIEIRSTTIDEREEIFPTRTSKPLEIKEEQINFNNYHQKVSTEVKIVAEQDGLQ